MTKHEASSILPIEPGKEDAIRGSERRFRQTAAWTVGHGEHHCRHCGRRLDFQGAAADLRQCCHSLAGFVGVGAWWNIGASRSVLLRGARFHLPTIRRRLRLPFASIRTSSRVLLRLGADRGGAHR